MPACSRCRRNVAGGHEWCPHCGARLQSAVVKATNRAIRYLSILAAAIVGSAVVVAGYWYFELRPRMKRLEDPMWGNEPSRETRIAVETFDDEWFDREMRLPAGPKGAAWDGTHFVMGNREDPWGFFRISARTNDWMLQTVPVIDREYAQRMGIDAVTWNGANFVGIADGAWFQKNDTVVFTIHDARDLQITSVLPAPDDLGAIAWDGEHYWVATRSNTETSGETPRLAKLDIEFGLIDSWNPPGIGCQGLAWDGSFLWFVDVFEDSVFVLDVAQGPPSVVHSHDVGNYPSGVVWDGSHIWIADYEGNRLRRVRHDVRMAWLGGRSTVEPDVTSAPAAPGGSSDEIATLHEQLRSDDWSVRMRAESRLREIGASIPHQRFTNSFRRDDTPDKVDLDELVVELRGNDLVASWDLYIGESYFSTKSPPSEGPVSIPLFVRYEVSVDSSAPGFDVEKEYTPRPGRNVERDVVLASNLRPGRYTVNVFIHIQYVHAEEGPQILNLNEESLTVELR